MGNGLHVRRGDGADAFDLFLRGDKASAAGKITFLVEHGKAVTKGQVVATIA